MPLTILHGCVIEKQKIRPNHDVRTMTISDVLANVVRSQGDSLELFFKKNAFDRRDVLKSLSKKTIVRLTNDGKVCLRVICRTSMDPDEKAMLAGISPYADTEISARV